MSNYYYCNECLRPTDLEKKEVPDKYYGVKKYKLVCIHCGSANIKAIIDKG